MIVFSSIGVIYNRINKSPAINQQAKTDSSVLDVDFSSMSRDELKVCLVEKNISFQPNIKTSKIIELLKGNK
jgi:hypothetical protein